MGRWLVLALVTALAGCGGDVIVETSDLSSDPTGPSASGGPPVCSICGYQECGICQYAGGDFAFSCRNGARPPLGSDCLETGSVYADGDDFYECWRCFDN